MGRRLVMAVVALSFAASMYAAKITEGFEDKAVLKKWEIEGDAIINSVQKHGGKSALHVPAGASAVFRFSPENKYGTVTMWVYDSFVNKSGKGMSPQFGIINSDDDKALLVLSFAPQVSPTVYSDIFTAENQMFNIWYSGIHRPKAAWAKFSFSFPDDKSLGLNCNDEKEDSVFSTKLEFFSQGANGITIAGGNDFGEKNETFYFDDIEIDVKDAPKKAAPAPAAK